VALLWESDALIARSEGERLDIVIPRTTILAETAVAVVDSNVRRRGTQDIAQAFVEFLFTPEAQRIFAEEGLRPVDEQVLAASAEKYPTPENGALTIADFGGWSSAGTRFFSTSGVYARIEADAAKAK
jgi:sulfate transport system substrate-binding protein